MSKMPEKLQSPLFLGRIDDLIKHYKGVLSGKLDISSLFEVLTRFVASARSMTVHELTAQGDPQAFLDFATIKTAVMQAVEKFYDEVVVPFDIPFVPEFIEKTFIDPKLKDMILKAASGILDAVVKMGATTKDTSVPVGRSGTFEPY